ncbi:sugar phosphate isomerase/epimerase family protein [Cupriavidus necator]
MRIAISNIAWDVSEDESVAALLHKFGVDAIDVAPGKYFPDPEHARDADIARVRDQWKAHGIELTGMQSLLFGTSGLNMFGSSAARSAMLNRLAAVARIGGKLGATRLVFGSPKNRDRGALDDREVAEIAVPFFRELGDIAHGNGVTFCLEPNPVCYGANFMTTSAETASMVRLVAHPAIRMQFDTGSLAINGEAPADVLEHNADLIGHVHASEPELVPLGDGRTDHAAMAAQLATHLPGHVVSIEMVATANEPHLPAIQRALATAQRWYRQAPGVQFA